MSSGAGGREVVPEHADGSITSILTTGTIVDDVSVPAGETLTVRLRNELTHTALALISYENAALRVTVLKR